jgi:TATA-box binding protein (TBP) (component of TFIID and TFIIIB)
MKRAHEEALVNGDALAEGTTTEPPAKKARRQRISKKFQFLPLDMELCKRFIVDAPVNELAERVGSQRILADLVRGEHVQKHEIAITKDLKMTVHNIVFTCEFYERHDGSAAAASAPSSRGDASSLRRAGDSYELDDDEDISLDLEIAPTSPRRAAHLQEEEEEDKAAIATFHATQATEPLAATPSVPIMALGQAYHQGHTEEGKTTKGRVFYDIPLRRLIYYMRGYGAQLNTKRFTAVVLRNDALSAASLIFSSKMVSTGCARFELAIELMRDTLSKIRSVGYDEFQDPVPCLRNIVSNGQFPRPICTNMMTLKYAEYCRRVALFPGVMFNHPDMGSRVILIFESGQLCHSGAERIEQLYEDVCLVYPKLVECIRTRRTHKIDAQCARILNLDLPHVDFDRVKGAALAGQPIVTTTTAAPPLES